MTDEIDSILSREDEMLPSSGFTTSVMEAVRQEAAEPPPIPFPWKRALPCAVMAVLVLVLTGGVLVSEIAGLAKEGTSVPTSSVSPAGLMFANSAMSHAIGWMVAGLVLALVSVAFSLRLGSRTV